MSPASFFVLAAAWLIIFWCNLLMPMLGDDYLYSFVISDNAMFYNFVPELAVRVSSFADIFVSLWNHYFIWGGRMVSHFFDQLFGWLGKPLFNPVNAFMFVLLMMEVHWISDRGRVSLDLKPGRIIWIFFAFWIFPLNFPSVFLWMTGSCNYLWTAVIVLGFLIPYVRQWFSDRPLEINPLIMLSAGVIAGWTNENNICWIIVAIALMCRRLRAEHRMSRWMIAGLIGLSIGYALLILAPGNVARAFMEMPEPKAIIFHDFNQAVSMMIIIVISQGILWYFLLRTLYRWKDFGDSLDVRRSLTAVKTFASISALSIVIMLLSPVFNVHSLFPGLVCLIIAVTIIIRMQHEIKPLPRSLRIFFHVIGGLLFTVSIFATIMCESIQWNYYRQVEQLAEHERAVGSNKIIEVPGYDYPAWLKTLGFSHATGDFFRTADDPHFWVNKTYSRYHGIKGILPKPARAG